MENPEGTVEVSPDEMKLYPPWKQAANQFLEKGFQPGDLVTHEWLYAAFEITMPLPETPKKVADKLELLYVAQFTEFRTYMLAEHKVDLDSKPGVGYIVVPPQKQSLLAHEDGWAEVKKAIRKMGRRQANVNLEMLSAEERRENADLLAKTAALAGMVKQAKKLPSSQDVQRLK